MGSGAEDAPVPLNLSALIVLASLYPGSTVSVFSPVKLDTLGLKSTTSLSEMLPWTEDSKLGILP